MVKCLFLSAIEIITNWNLFSFIKQPKVSVLWPMCCTEANHWSAPEWWACTPVIKFIHVNWVVGEMVLLWPTYKHCNPNIAWSWYLHNNGGIAKCTQLVEHKNKLKPAGLPRLQAANIGNAKGQGSKALAGKARERRGGFLERSHWLAALVEL